LATPTIAGIEEDLGVLVGPFMALVTTTDAEREAVLRMAVSFAASRLPDFETADAHDVTDDDVAGLTRIQLGTFVALAEYKALWVIYDRYTAVDQKAGEESQSLSQAADRLWKKIERLGVELDHLVAEPDVVAATTPGATLAGRITVGQCYPPTRNHWYCDAYGRRYY
jgi:hypothetical protein